MQQSSATPNTYDAGIGLWKIVACSHSSSQCLLVPTVFGTVSSPHPTLLMLSLDCSARRDDDITRTCYTYTRTYTYVRTYAHAYCNYCAREVVKRKL